MSFSFEDFRLFTKAPNVDHKVFSIIAPGVIEEVRKTYGIFLESTTGYEYLYFNDTTLSSYDIPLSPINAVTGVSQDGISVGFTYFGRDVNFTTSVTASDIPIKFTLDLGYTSESMPADLKMAVYMHMESAYFSYKNSVDNVQKVINTTGNTTYYKDTNIPKASMLVYGRYSNRNIIKY